jgi:hypothetical protein
MKWRENFFSDIIESRKRRILIVSFLDCIQKKKAWENREKELEEGSLK